MIKNLIICAFLLLASDLVSCAPCRGGTKRYYLSIDKANFFQAFINCQQGGMQLATVNNLEESNALDAYLDPYKVDGYDNAFWLSGTNYNDPTSKIYYWLSTGQRAIFTNWMFTEPDNYLGLQHAMAWAYVRGVTGWSDHNAEKLLRYVCEYTSYN